MKDLIPVPSKGTPLLASWGAHVANGINSLASMSAPGMLSRDGVTGTGSEPFPKNMRERRSEAFPFQVRHVEQDEQSGIPYTGWEIYLPSGCMNVNTTCAAMNARAFRTVNDDEVPVEGWYRMPCPATGPTTGNDWFVRVHAKCNSAMDGVDQIASWPKNYMWADIDVESPNDMTSFAGDNLCVTVGRISLVTVGSESVKKYTQTLKSAVSATAAANEQMELLHVFSVDEDDVSLSLERIFVRNFSFAAAGMTYISANSLNEIDAESEEVYLNVNAETSPFTASVNGYKATNGNSATSLARADQGPFKLQIMLFKLKDGCVTTDARKNLCNVQIYKN